MAHPEDDKKNAGRTAERGRGGGKPPESRASSGRGRMRYYDLSVDDVPETRRAPGQETAKYADRAQAKNTSNGKSRDKGKKEKGKKQLAARRKDGGDGSRQNVSAHGKDTRAKDTRAKDAGTQGGRTKPRRNRKKRRRLPKAVTAVIVVLLVLAAGLGSSAYFLKIGDIAVKGKSVYTSAQITNASGLHQGSRLLLADRASAQQRLSVELPYILGAKIHYLPPDGFLIEVKPDAACLCVKTDAGYTALDAYGKVLGTEKDKNKLPGAVETTGVDVKGVLPGHKLGGEALKKTLAAGLLLGELKRNKVTGITYVDVTSLYEIKAGYAGRVDVLIGTSADMASKVRFAADILVGKDKLTDTDKGVLDVSESAQTNKARFIPS